MHGVRPENCTKTELKGSVVYKATCVTCEEKGPTPTATKDGQVKRVERKAGTKSSLGRAVAQGINGY